jgi:diguanylate cyclase (GGDEF)-like protein
MDGAAEELETEPCELRLIGPDDRYVWVSLRMSAVHDRRWQPQFVLVHVEDIGERKLREQELARAARTDPLTGLPNVAEMRDRIAGALRGGQAVGVLFGDFDRFKLINDSYGHLVGDEVLVELGRRLRRGVRADDMVARIGGDEFVVLVVDRTMTEVAELAERLTRLASRPIRVGVVEVVISVSFGYAHRDATADPPTDPESVAIEATRLLRAADGAMYRLKHGRRLRNVGGA